MRAGPKDLPAVNDALELDIPTDRNGAVCLQYVSGAGTIVVEATVDNSTWVQLRLTDPATKADVDNRTTPGLAWCDVVGYEKVRARKAVGVASCVVALNFALG